MSRVETGVVQFDDDWPGVFIRGDDAVYLVMNLMRLLAYTESFPLDEKSADMWLVKPHIEGFIKILVQSNCNSKDFKPDEVQKIKIAELT